MTKQYKKYIRNFCVFGLILLLLATGFNWLINPYGIFGSPAIRGLNAVKTEAETHTRMMKAYAVRAVKPEAIVIGTSRADGGIDPDHEGWGYGPVYNLSIAGANVYEMFRYFQHAQNINPLEQVLLNMDFFAFGTNNAIKKDFDETELSVGYDGQATDSGTNFKVKSLISVDTLISSISTVMNQSASPDSLRNGLADTSAWETMVEAKGGYHAYFNSTHIEYAKDLYIPECYRIDVNAPDSPFTYYRKMLQMGYRENIDIKIITSPCHARQWEVLEECGLWQVFEDWKRTLVSINEEEARLAGKTPFAFWDFSVLNELTTEAVPPLGDTKTQMRWYRDPSHYKVQLGDLVLDRIFNYHKEGRAAPDDFGVMVTSENIESHLAKIRADSRQYRDTHPDDIMEIIEICKNYAHK
jgi:hypothetical protein